MKKASVHLEKIVVDAELGLRKAEMKAFETNKDP